MRGPAFPRSRLDIVFMGSAAFAVPPLEALIGAGHRVRAVYTRAPRPAGRGRRPHRGPVHAVAAERGLEVLTPTSLKDMAEQRRFTDLRADAAVVAAYGLILPKPILEAPRLGCLNVHASLLPRWRGAAPIQRAVLAGDAETGVTIMRMDEGLDTGAIVLAESVAVGSRATAAELHETLAALGARLILDALDGLAAGTLAPTPQPEVGVTLAPKLSRADGRLDWRRPAAELERRVRAFTPWPGAWFTHGAERIKVIAAEVARGRPGAAPGTVLDDALAVACGEGALRLLRVQREGRDALDAPAFLRGYAIAPGGRLD